jgi:hypothetical protein
MAKFPVKALANNYFMTLFMDMYTLKRHLIKL